VAKVSDFGLSVKVDEGASHVSNAHHGTPFYMAPEVTHAGFLSLAADSYSFGAPRTVRHMHIECRAQRPRNSAHASPACLLPVHCCARIRTRLLLTQLLSDQTTLSRTVSLCCGADTSQWPRCCVRALAMMHVWHACRCDDVGDPPRHSAVRVELEWAAHPTSGLPYLPPHVPAVIFRSRDRLPVPRPQLSAELQPDSPSAR
jgi:serine/threonine protein kinase